MFRQFEQQLVASSRQARNSLHSAPVQDHSEHAHLLLLLAKELQDSKVGLAELAKQAHRLKGERSSLVDKDRLIQKLTSELAASKAESQRLRDLLASINSLVSGP